MLEPKFTSLSIHGRFAAANLPSGRSIVLLPRVASATMGQWLRHAGLAACDPGAVVGAVATFVRNPFERLASAYDFWRHAISFGEFVASLAVLRADVHVRPQSELVESPAFVGRYESLAEDWQRFCAWGGLPHSPLVQRLRQSEHPRETYSREQRAAVARFYADDLARFGYS